jgi:hypothetical protein
MTKKRDVLKELRAAPAVLSNIGPPLGRILSDAAEEIERLRKALKETKHFFLGHFDDSCEECRRGLATIDAALNHAPQGRN